MDTDYLPITDMVHTQAFFGFGGDEFGEGEGGEFGGEAGEVGGAEVGEAGEAGESGESGERGGDRDQRTDNLKFNF